MHTQIIIRKSRKGRMIALNALPPGAELLRSCQNQFLIQSRDINFQFYSLNLILLFLSDLNYFCAVFTHRNKYMIIHSHRFTSFTRVENLVNYFYVTHWKKIVTYVLGWSLGFWMLSPNQAYYFAVKSLWIKLDINNVIEIETLLTR